MEKARICKICSKRFSNGKAMGGHMRSHLAKFPLPPKPQQFQSSISISSSSSSSLRFPSQSYRSVNHDLLQASRPHSNLVRDRGGDVESDSESPVATTRRRSKRLRKSAELVVKAAETSPEQVSSLSDEMLNEEEVALCLLMLSRDTEKVSDRNEEDAAEMVVVEDGDEDEDELFDEMPLRSKSNFIYKCTTCKKNFRSYQALGGHKASHKKTRKEENSNGADSGSSTAAGGGSGAVSAVVVDQKTFKCPFCEKVFESGQALGGHKKVHFSYLGNNNDAKAVTPKPKMLNFDLNLPAPEEDDDDVVELESGQVYGLRNRKLEVRI